MSFETIPASLARAMTSRSRTHLLDLAQSPHEREQCCNTVRVEEVLPEASSNKDRDQSVDTSNFVDETKEKDDFASWMSAYASPFNIPSLMSRMPKKDENTAPGCTLRKLTRMLS